MKQILIACFVSALIGASITYYFMRPVDAPIDIVDNTDHYKTIDSLLDVHNKVRSEYDSILRKKDIEMKIVLDKVKNMNQVKIIKDPDSLENSLNHTLENYKSWSE